VREIAIYGHIAVMETIPDPSAARETIPDPSAGRETVPDPLWTAAPATAEEVAAALRRAADARQPIQIRGAGTKRGWGAPIREAAAVLDMRGLNRVLAHEHGDMTATVEAGATLREVNRALALHRQWLPLDPPFADTATIGGILATNDSGPLRHRYGTPRDLVIGIRLATTDGVLSKAGGQVVKNVAGYDLGKLMAGSFGSLAAIVSATFKLSPIPQASKTLRLEVDGAAGVARIVTAVMGSHLEPLGFEIAWRAGRDAQERRELLLCFASLDAVVDAQVAQADALLKGLATRVDTLSSEREPGVWREHADQIWTDPDRDAAVVRVSWLPANIDAALAAVKAGTANSDAIMIGRAAIGAGLIRIGGAVDAQVRAIDALRTSTAIGNVTIVRGSPPLVARVDVWPADTGRARLFTSLQQAFDPAHVLVGQGPR
jgi:glycolate oxidase FAD binding subunit